MRNWDAPIAWAQWPPSAHAAVVDVAGNKIGTLAELNAPAGYLRVKHGWLHRQAWYVPLGAVSRIDAHHRIVLRYTTTELDHQLWASPPRSQPSATTMAQEQAHVVSPPTTQVTPAQARPATDLPVRTEEELVPHREWRTEGIVRVHKEMVEEPATVSAPVVHEAVRVEHIAPDANALADDHAFHEESFDMPVLGQELVAEKRTKVSDEVRLHKEPLVTNEAVTGTVRHEYSSLGEPDDEIVPTDDAHLSDQSAQW